ncbi:MAG: type I-F CRISPR-associated endoribonuclease Cas6/Csy4 [Azonexus sp.]|nr:type I-F CRISPR-associated endoribonuclease Cas6/Csy4 [Azonexus sp.]MCK6412928.1 type I-F CRISPR-associated endoribonuclease Cas6/Csy4 [Azonexus sp.]
MDAYLELQLLPDPEFPPAMLMNALFAKLHRALVSHGEGRIGISFPDVEAASGTLGMRLRLHGQASDLAQLQNNDWLRGMRDHLRLTEIGPVPSGASHRVVSRVQAQSSPERLRRRAMRRHHLSPEAALERIPDHPAERLNLPYLTLTSQSTGQQFRLFIEHRPLQAQASPGQFSTYGLSPSTSIPWF